MQNWMPLAIRSGTALSGLLLVLFLVVHLAGVIPALAAPEAFEHYAVTLHSSPWLPVLELALATAGLAHIMLSLFKSAQNRQAGNRAKLNSRREQPLAAFASRNKLSAGLITLSFLIIHLQQLRLPRPAAGHERELLLAVLHQPFSLGLYVAACLALGLHLLHGAEAAHRSLGLLTPMNSSKLRNGGRLLAIVIGGGFLLTTLGLAFGDF